MCAIDDDYFHRYDELKTLLIQAYIDIYSLQAIEDFKKSAEKRNIVMMKSSLFVFQHICELLKADLGLTVWKMLYDDNEKANTIYKLSSYIHRKYTNITNCKSEIKTKLPNNLKNVAIRLDTIRKQRLAHNDLKKQNKSVELTELIDLIEFLRPILNGLCYPEIDNRVSQISDQNLRMLRFDVSLGFNFILNRSSFQNATESENE